MEVEVIQSFTTNIRAQVVQPRATQQWLSFQKKLAQQRIGETVTRQGIVRIHE